MAIQRRGFFRGLFATPVAAAAKPLARLLPPAPVAVARPYAKLSELVTLTLRNRTPQLIENITRNNAILRHLQGMK